MAQQVVAAVGGRPEPRRIDRIYVAAGDWRISEAALMGTEAFYEAMDVLRCKEYDFSLPLIPIHEQHIHIDRPFRNEFENKMKPTNPNADTYVD